MWFAENVSRNRRLAQILFYLMQTILFGLESRRGVRRAGGSEDPICVVGQFNGSDLIYFSFL
jgi:hypothetical protein